MQIHDRKVVRTDTLGVKPAGIPAEADPSKVRNTREWTFMVSFDMVSLKEE
jgi:hypothetical protein